MKRPAVAATLAAALLFSQSVAAKADEPISISGATFSWGMNPNISSIRSPAGYSRYLSAGDPGQQLGESVYASKSGNVEIFQKRADGTVVSPTYATRADYVTNGGSQYFEFSNGTGQVNSDKSVDISWTGTVVVNEIGGVLSYSLSDPKLHVNADGTGRLSATLAGWSVNRLDLSQRAYIPAIPEQTVADFENVTLPSATGAQTLELNPTWSGVVAPVRKGQAEQVQTDNWGSWPADFVGFQNMTNLSSFYYSSGSHDENKVPLPITVKYEAGATKASEPVKAENGLWKILKGIFGFPVWLVKQIIGLFGKD
ncbi:MAG: HtaA domain-containing protein [Corynebacterium sp.]|nr:HtaA domain-containing protein [Corynebacterium sp.]